MGPGTDTFDLLGVMQRWVEMGEAPNDVPASRVEHGRVVRTRPLCPVPQVATYRGTGSTDEASNCVLQIGKRAAPGVNLCCAVYVTSALCSALQLTNVSLAGGAAPIP